MLLRPKHFCIFLDVNVVCRFMCVVVAFDFYQIVSDPHWGSIYQIKSISSLCCNVYECFIHSRTLLSFAEFSTAPFLNATTGLRQFL